MKIRTWEEGKMRINSSNKNNKNMKIINPQMHQPLHQDQRDKKK